MTGNGGATDPGEGAAENHFQGVTLDDGPDEIMLQVVQDGPGYFRGQRPFAVTGAESGFFQGKYQPWLVETGRLDSGGGDQGQRPREDFFSGHRGF